MPKKRTNPTLTKRRKETIAKQFDPGSFFGRSISWRYCFMDTLKWSAVGQLDELRKKLVSYERMTWAEIDGASKSAEGSKNHFVDVENLCKEAQKRLEALHLHYNQLYSIALTGRQRLYGIVDEGVFNILWYDPEHEVYPVTKKHT